MLARSVTHTHISKCVMRISIAHAVASHLVSGQYRRTMLAVELYLIALDHLPTRRMLPIPVFQGTWQMTCATFVEPRDLRLRAFGQRMHPVLFRQLNSYEVTHGCAVLHRLLWCSHMSDAHAVHNPDGVRRTSKSSAIGTLVAPTFDVQYVSCPPHVSDAVARFSSSGEFGRQCRAGLGLHDCLPAHPLAKPLERITRHACVHNILRVLSGTSQLLCRRLACMSERMPARSACAHAFAALAVRVQNLCSCKLYRRKESFYHAR